MINAAQGAGIRIRVIPKCGATRELNITMLLTGMGNATPAYTESIRGFVVRIIDPSSAHGAFPVVSKVHLARFGNVSRPTAKLDCVLSVQNRVGWSAHMLMHCCWVGHWVRNSERISKSVWPVHMTGKLWWPWISPRHKSWCFQLGPFLGVTCVVRYDSSNSKGTGMSSRLTGLNMVITAWQNMMADHFPLFDFPMVLSHFPG